MHKNYENLAIDVALASAMNRPDCEGTAAATDWLTLVRTLIVSMQWPRDQWAFGEVRHVEGVRDRGIVATISFTCGVSVTAEIGVYAPRNMGKVWLAFEDMRRVVHVDTVDFTSQNSPTFLDVIKKMTDEIHARLIQTAWKSGNAVRPK